MKFDKRFYIVARLHNYNALHRIYSGERNPPNALSTSNTSNFLLGPKNRISISERPRSSRARRKECATRQTDHRAIGSVCTQRNKPPRFSRVGTVKRIDFLAYHYRGIVDFLFAIILKLIRRGIKFGIPLSCIEGIRILHARGEHQLHGEHAHQPA